MAKRPSAGAYVRPMSAVAARPVEWLWPGWIALGKLTVLDGDPGMGKSTLLLDLAARLSRDGLMPDGPVGPVGAPLILSAEDGEADTIKPRLAAAGDSARSTDHRDGQRALKQAVVQQRRIVGQSDQVWELFLD
jgi:replicative DNA helicase